MSNSSKVVHPFFQLQQQKKHNVSTPTTATTATVINNLSVYQSPPKIKSEQQQQPTPNIEQPKLEQKTFKLVDPQPVELPKTKPNPKAKPSKKAKAKAAAELPTKKAPKSTTKAQKQSQKTVSKTTANAHTPAKASCSIPQHVPIIKPKFYSDTLEYKAQQEHNALFNFYGRINKNEKKYYDHDFSRLDRAIYGNAHIRSSPICITVDHLGTDSDYTLRRSSSPAVDMKLLIDLHQHEFFQKSCNLRKANQKSTQKRNSNNNKKKKYQLKTQSELEDFLDRTFPHWHTFPACVILSRLVFNKLNTVQTNQQQSWIDKYRPKSVNGLLGERLNHVYLKDWLHQMKIEPMSAPTSNSTGAKRKTKKKKLHLHDLDDLSLREDDDDDDFMPIKKPAKQLKKESMKSNMILIAGDYGVGKTASVYTAADQLGYEVFEINSGTRRSGKDIMSMVGEMTKSHLVAFGLPQVQQQLQAMQVDSSKKEVKMKKRRLNPCLSNKSLSDQSKDVTSSSSNEREDEAGLLKHFLRKKETPALTTALKKKQPSSSKEPKQSLILLEEVDLLFEEDKAFWTSVIELSQKSKRPIIMTCNDPEQVPFESLCLQVILEIKPPSEAELLPYLWLLCFSEGYTIDPADLIRLMAVIGRDIRQLIQTLEMYIKNHNETDQQSVFDAYLGIDHQESISDMKSKCIPSRVAVDTYRLARSSYETVGDTMEEDDDLEGIEKALEDNAFMDTWLGWKENGNRVMVHESVQDQINGFTNLWFEDDEESESKLILRDLEYDISVMNSSSMKSKVWRDIISDETSRWDEVCDTRAIVFEEYTDAITKLLSIELLYQPNEQIIMMEYIPYIKQMIMADSKAKTVKTRSKRRRLYLPLSEDSVQALTMNRPLIDEVKLNSG